MVHSVGYQWREKSVCGLDDRITIHNFYDIRFVSHSYFYINIIDNISNNNTTHIREHVGKAIFTRARACSLAPGARLSKAPRLFGTEFPAR